MALCVIDAILGKAMYLRVCISILLPFSWFAVSLMAFFNPSGTLPMQALSTSGYIVILGAPLVFSAAVWVILGLKTRKRFFISLAVFFIFSCSFILYATLQYHRDYASLFYQFMLLFLVMFLIKIPFLNIIRNRQRVYRALESVAWVVALGACVWIFLMCYAIVIRSEPRWLESIVYNAVLGLIMILLLMSRAYLHEQSYKQFFINFDQRVVLDERDISSFFTQQQQIILQCFLDKPEKSCTCTELLLLLNNSTQNLDCSRCREENWSAISCKFYRNIKNQILLLKKSLEMLGIGSIVEKAENFRNNKTDGWQLRFFDDVRFKQLPSKTRT